MMETHINAKSLLKIPAGIHMYKYLPRIGSAGTKLLFTFRSWIHGLNEELGRHGGREGKLECTYCTLSIVCVCLCQLLVVHVVEPFCGRILV